MADEETYDHEQIDSINRRRFIQTTGVGLVGIAGFSGRLSAQDEPAFKLEAVAREDDENGGGPPDHANNPEHAWVGVAPEEIAGETNPTLTLVAGKDYTVKWTNTDGDPHNFVIEDINGKKLLNSKVRPKKDATQTVEFTATEEMAEYYCQPHAHDMRGDLDVADAGPPMPPKEDYEGIVGMHPEDAMETFSVADGYNIELVASEPLVNNPVDIRFDAKGNIWVVQMPEYLNIVPGDGRGGVEPGNWPDGKDHIDRSLEELTGWEDEKTDEPPNGAVKVLEDTDGDGMMDKATTFLDGLTLPRALSLVEGDDALLVAQAGQNVDDSDLPLGQDTDDDLVSEEVEGMKEAWVDPEYVELASNSLEFMLNNWIYSSVTTDRFQVRDSGLVERSNDYTFGQWGLTEDNYGRTFHTWNNQWLNGDIVPSKGDYLFRGGDNDENGLGVSLDAGNNVHSIRPNRGTNRFYRDGGDDGRLHSVTAVSGPEAYRGHLFPDDYVNDVFSPAPQVNVVGHISLEDEEGGLGIQEEHVTYPYNIEENPYEDEIGDIEETEFVASTDEIFRPVNIRTGPDGALYIVDMYAGMLQHWLSMTAYMADYYVEHEMWEIGHLEHGSGRIWRVYPEDAELDDSPELDELDPDELAGMVEHDNGWVRKTAQRLIVQDNETDTASTLQEIAQESDHHLGRMHALWSLHGIDEIDADSVFAVMDDINDSHILANAMQTGEALLGTDDTEAYVDRLVDFADADHLRLVVQAAYSLGEVTDDDPDLQDTARYTLEGLLDEHKGNDYVEDAVHSSPEMDFDDDDDNGDEEPVATFEFDGQTGGWVGIAPGEIENEENPTLTLEEGEMYEIGWTTGDGAPHNIAIHDGEGNVVNDLSTDVTTDPGSNQWLEFEATAEMAVYICEVHPSSMIGDINIQ